MKKSTVHRATKPQKFSTRKTNRCQRCGRSHAVYRHFKLCRICIRELVYKGELPGVRKSSW